MAESLGTAVLDLTTDDAGLTRGLRSAETRSRSVFTGIMGSAVRMAATVGTAYGAFRIGKSIISSAGDFQQTLNVLWATAKHGNVTMSDVSKRAMQLGADIRLPAVSANDAAKAMLELAKGGLTAKEAMGAARATLLLSTAAQIDGATAATAIASAMGQFGLSARNTQVIVDDFAGAANNSTASMNDVSLALQQSGGAFHALGIPIGDAATAIAAMANAGYRGSDAGTALKTMLQSLNPHTKQAKEAFEKMGISAYDSNEKFVGFRSVIEQLGPKLQGMTDKQKGQTIQTIFGTDAARAANVIFGMSAKQYDKLRAAVTKSGQAQKIATAQTQGFNGAMSALQSSLETLGLKIGTAVLPQLTKLVEWLGKVVSAPSIDVAINIIWKGIAAFAGNLKDAIERALLGNERAIDVSNLSFNVNGEVKTDPGLIEKMRTAFEGVVSRIDWTAVGNKIGAAISKSVKITTEGFDKFANAALAWADSHAGQIAAVGAKIGLNVIAKLLDPAFWAQNWALIGGILISVFPAGKFAVLGEKLAAGGFALFGKTAGKWILDGLALLPGVIGQFAPRFAKAIGDMIAKAVPLAVNAMITLTGRVVGAISGGFGRLGGVVRVALNTGIVAVIGKTIGAAADKAEELASNVANGIKTIPSNLGNLTSIILNPISSALQSVAHSAYNFALTIGSNIAHGVVAGIGDLAGAVASKVTGALGAGMGLIKKVQKIRSPSQLWADEIGFPVGQGIVIGASEGVKELSAKLTEGIKKALGDSQKITTENLPSVRSAFKEWAKAAGDALEAEASTLKDRFKAQLDKTLAQVDAWKAKLTPAEIKLNAQKAIEEAGRLTGAISDAWNAMQKLPQQQADAMAALLKQQQDTMKGLQANVISTRDDVVLAQNTFSKGMAANVNDPVAQALIAAQDAFNTVKGWYDQGLTTQEDFVNAANALDAAKLAASEDTNAQTLLDQYNTWQTALANQAAAGAAITAQQAADADAQAALRASFDQQEVDAKAAYETAIKALADAGMEQRARDARAARDKYAREYSADLTGLHERFVTHLDNQVDVQRKRLNTMAANAGKGGKNLVESMAEGIRNGIPTLEGALKAVANTVAAYLKVRSPTDKGPMSDLDKWWGKFGATIVSGMDSKVLTHAISGALTPNLNAGLMGAYAGGELPKLAPPSAGGLHGPVNVTNNFNQTPANANPVAISESIAWRMRNLRS